MEWSIDIRETFNPIQFAVCNTRSIPAGRVPVSLLGMGLKR